MCDLGAKIPVVKSANMLLFACFNEVRRALVAESMVAMQLLG